MRYRFLRFPGGKSKAFTLSYDDGNPADIKLSEIITKYGVKCTFNLNGDAIKKTNGITKEEAIEHILSKRHEIAVHGNYHRAEGSIRPIEGIRDVLDCRIELEEKYDMIIRGMAYPDCGIRIFSNNTTYEMVKNYLTELDIAYARSLGADNNSFELPNDWHRWIPTAHHNNPKIMEYLNEFLSLDISPKTYHATRRPRLFYMWGHSYEFVNDNNWEHLEEICRKVSDHEDIWHATNMEICEYVNAYNSLIYSAGGKIIYNPSLIDIWFDVDGVLYEIKSGQTIKF